MSLSVPFVGVGFSTFNPISHRLYPSNAPFFGWTRSHTQVHFTFRLNLIVDFLPPSFRRCCLLLQFHSRKFTFLSVFGKSGIPASGHIHFLGGIASFVEGHRSEAFHRHASCGQILVTLSRLRGRDRQATAMGLLALPFRVSFLTVFWETH